jgi:hypothetical protein
VLLLVRGSQAVRAIHISSGAPGTSTPPGSFKIYRKARKDWVVPVQGLAPVCELLQRRHRLPRVSGRAAVPGLARARARPARRCPDGVPLHHAGDAGLRLPRLELRPQEVWSA